MSGSSNTITVYRSGLLENPDHYGVAHGLYEIADAARPSGRAGRMDGLFCAVDLLGLARWTHAMCMTAETDAEVQPRALRINPDGVFVYRVSDWDRVDISNPHPDHLSTYWRNGLPILEWLDRHAAGDQNLCETTDWEALVPVSAVKSTRNVATSRILAAQAATTEDFRAEEMRRSFQRRGLVVPTRVPVAA